MKRENIFSSFAFHKGARYEQQESIHGGRGKDKDESQEFVLKVKGKEDNGEAELVPPAPLLDTMAPSQINNDVRSIDSQPALHTGRTGQDRNVAPETLAPLFQLSDGVQDRMRAIVQVEDTLVDALEKVTFAHPVSHVYNPLLYAKQPHRHYLQLYGGRQVAVLLVGMNPGPFGMCQTGVPFGDVPLVKGYLGVGGEVEQPVRVHSKRPIHGFKCKRREVSGQRLWGWVQSKWPNPDEFFQKFFVYNYCPLAFMEASSRNRTPDKLSIKERDTVLGACDVALRDIIHIIRPQFVVGVGKFAEGRIRKCGALDIKIGSIMHPSPVNPLANKDWDGTIERQFAEIGVDVRGV